MRGVVTLTVVDAATQKVVDRLSKRYKGETKAQAQAANAAAGKFIQDMAASPVCGDNFNPGVPQVAFEVHYNFKAFFEPDGEMLANVSAELYDLDQAEVDAIKAGFKAITA